MTKTNTSGVEKAPIADPAIFSRSQGREMLSMSSNLAVLSIVGRARTLVRVGRDGRLSLKVPMRSNDVVLVLLEPAARAGKQ